MIYCEKGDSLKGKRIAVVFQTLQNSTKFHGSGRHNASAVVFKGNAEKPVVCTLEQAYHIKK